MYENIIKKISKMYKEGDLTKEKAAELLKTMDVDDIDIAVIGMGCKNSVSDDYNNIWETAKNKKSIIKSCPQGRIDLVKRYVGENGESDEMYHHGAILSDYGDFDYELFGFTKEEASLMEPMQRTMLKASYRAIEDAGYFAEREKEDQTGVYIGANFSLNQYVSYLKLTGDRGFETIMLNWTNGAATRISNIFDFRGVSTVIENSCVAAIVAIYEACNLLKLGKIKTALVGGISSALLPDKRISINKVFAHDGDVVSRPYDQNPGGNYLGEGAAALFLKPLKDAVRDRDRIHGVIKGCHINNNGSLANFTQSNAEIIAEVIKGACTSAKISPEDIGYVEGEGYCENLEQALEVTGLTKGFKKYTNKKQYCALGAFSANIGYTEVAVGIFNSIACLMAIKNKQIPPVYGFEIPSEIYDLCDSPFYINDSIKDWRVEDGKKRNAALFSQGFGGGNGFLILQEAPERNFSIHKKRDKYILALSAHTKNSFDKQAEQYIHFLEDDSNDADLGDICYTLCVRRPHYSPYRMIVVGESKEDIVMKLKNWFVSRSPNESVYMNSSKLKSPGQVSKHMEQIKKAAASKDYKVLADYYINGYSIKFSDIYSSSEGFNLVDLPNYKFTDSLCWVK